MAVLIENNYFKQMSDAFSTALKNIPQDHINEIYARDSQGNYTNQRAIDTYEILKEKVDQLVHTANQILAGNHERGSVHQVRINRDKYALQNMASNTRDREGPLGWSATGNIIPKAVNEYQHHDEKGHFVESAIKNLHPGMLPNASLEDRNDFLRQLARKNK